MFRTGISFLIWLCASLILPADDLPAQTIEKNDHVVYNVEKEGNQYLINYRFRDPFQNFQTYRLTLPAEETDLMIDIFGIPRWLFEPYIDNELNRKVREAEIKRGLFCLRDNMIEVDKSAVTLYYSEVFTRPIAEMIVSSLADYGADNKRNRIEFAIRFVQDIPYGIPAYNDSERHFGGVHIPPQLLLRGFGDCDSKALLFAGILIYLVPASDILFLNQKEHVLTAVRETPSEGDTYLKYQGDKFLVAETAGPGELPLGKKGDYYREQFRVEQLDIKSPEVIPYQHHPGLKNPQIAKTGVDGNTVILRNESERPLRFQISGDKRRWESIHLEAFHSGRYVFDRQTKIYVRIKSGNNTVTTFELGSGAAYRVSWNPKRGRWEISS